MKVCLILFSSLVLVASAAVFRQKSSDVVSMIENNGYTAETHDVTTSDGYILDLYRITRKRSQSTSNNRDSSEETWQEGSKRKVVLLMHGFWSSSIDFVIGGRENGLAYYLADLGYDVFMGNARGSPYGQRHTTLNPIRDEAFWNFCWQEIGTHDLPAIVDKVLSVSKQDKINFIGHMEGTTAFYVLTSQKTEYNDKFDRMISMGPMAFMKNSKNGIMQQIVDHISDKKWLMKNMGKSTFKPSNDLLENERTECRKHQMLKEPCNNAYMNFYGYSNQMNQTTLRNYLPHVPTGGSVKEVMHLAQLKRSGRFEMYRHNLGQSQTSVESNMEYDLSRISVPVAIMYTPNDSLANVEDVKTLIAHLPKVMGPVNFEQLHNNMDLLFSNNVRDNVYPVVRKMLREQTEKMIIHA